jgi:hypothetical protein
MPWRMFLTRPLKPEAQARSGFTPPRLRVGLRSRLTAGSIAIVLVALATVALLAGFRSLSLGQEQVSVPAPSSPPSLPADRCLGVGACASPACHGGADSADNIKRGKWSSSYTVWVERDKHAKAYAVLGSAESKKILRNLDRLGPDVDPMPQRDERCLACHSSAVRQAFQPDIAGRSQAGKPNVLRAFVADGVGCESCHGPARGWLAEHTSRTWSEADRAATHRDTHGPRLTDADAAKMVNTKDVKVRAQVCVDCHVGSAGGDGLPERNMNHDMIAAGHPRLTFEYSAFLANMPHHWDVKSTSGDGPPLRGWAVGQAVSAQASLRLLAARAKEAETDPAKTPWPELSEYDCYACHHALTTGSYHRKYMKPAGKDGVRPGSCALSRWYLPMTERLLQTSLESDASDVRLKELSELRQEMSGRSPRPKEVAAKASAAAGNLEPLISVLAKPSLPPGFAPRLFEGLKSEKEPPANWDEACMIYLLYRSAYRSESGLRPALMAVRKTLEFTSDPALPGGEVPGYSNSPRDFDPEKFAKALRELREQLPSAGIEKWNLP